MNAAHTPGPWRYVDFDNIIVAGPGRILDVQPRSLHVSKEERNANGFLVAAAPDLLADLREAAATLRRYEVLHRAKGTADSTEKAEVNAALAARFEATVAKATFL